MASSPTNSKRPVSRRLTKKFADLGSHLPLRMRGELRKRYPNIKRPYPNYKEDMEVLRNVLAELNKEMPASPISKRDARIPYRPHGVIFFHVLDVRRLILTKHNFLPGSPFCVYVEVECQDTVKCSDPVRSIERNKVRIDHAIHMNVELSEIRRSEQNDFLVHLYAFQDPQVHYLIGSQQIHLYEFAREMQGVSSINIISETSLCVGKLNFEFAWAYGTFGYGFSNQLKNLKIGSLETVCQSMFPRIGLDEDDLVYNRVRTRTPKKLRLVTLNNLVVFDTEEIRKKGTMQFQRPNMYYKVGFVPGKDNFVARSLKLTKVKYYRGTPVHAWLNLDIHQKFMEPDFNQSYGEFICLRNRRNRLEWLTKLTDGRIRDKEELEVGQLFLPYKKVEDAKVTLEGRRPLGCPPGHVERLYKSVYPPCQPIASSMVTEEDIWFCQRHLHSAPRFSGYLAYVFGYKKLSKHPNLRVYLENFHYHTNPKSINEHGQYIKPNLSTMTRWKRRVMLYIFMLKKTLSRLCEFVFPAIHRRSNETLPEISVTLPSPQLSTTDFHSFCTQKQIYEKETDFQSARRKTIAFLNMSRKKGGTNEEMGVDEYNDFYSIAASPYLGEPNRIEREIYA